MHDTTLPSANVDVSTFTGLVTHVDLNTITPNMLKRVYLRGLVKLFVDEVGKPWEDSWWWWWLSKGVERVEEGANVSIMPRQRIEIYDFKLSDYTQFAYFDLYHPPVHAVTRVRAIYPVTGVTPTTVTEDNAGILFDFPLEWVRLYPGGRLHLVPTSGTLSQVLIGRGGSYLPIFYGQLKYVPQLWRIEYISGFYSSSVPFIVADAVFKAAAIEALTVLADTLRPPGVKGMNTTYDRLNRTYQFEGGGPKVAALFTSRINAYRSDLYGSPDEGSSYQKGGLLQTIRDQFQGINMAVA